MKKLLLKMRNNLDGSALLVAILVMGVLISVSLALSSLIFREVRLTKDLIDSGRAYYAAESGIEEALYFLNTELPGWHTDETIGDVGEKAVFEYEVKNTCNSYPCFDNEEFDVTNVPLEAFYDVLELNETITIPLFTVEDGEIKAVEEFTVEFFSAFDPKDLKLNGAVNGWDVLRWKVFGLTERDGSYTTESIGDFTAFSSSKNHTSGEGDIFANVADPSWFGTVDCDDMVDRGSGVTGIRCNPYDFSTAINSDGEICTNTQSRDYWGYINGEVQAIHKCYDIGTFLDTHQPQSGIATGLNYLNLTNLMNPAVFDSDVYPTQESRTRASRLFFRVETFSDDTVREFADIVSDGYSGDIKQSLSVRIKRGSFIPVFNFSLYSTYKDEEKGEDQAYWYGSDEE